MSFSCEKCPKKFKTETLLGAHDENVHQIENDKREQGYNGVASVPKVRNLLLKSKYQTVVVQKKNQSVQTYKCRICDKLCSTIKSISTHIKKMHKSQPGWGTMCHTCGKGFRNEQSLKKHFSASHKYDVFKCFTCNACFDCEDKLVEHETMLHKESESYKCEQCEAVFDNAVSLRTHLISSHSQRSVARFQQKLKGYKRYRIYSRKSSVMTYGFECLECGKKSTLVNAIILHVRKEHGREGSETDESMLKSEQDIENPEDFEEALDDFNGDPLSSVNTPESSPVKYTIAAEKEGICSGNEVDNSKKNGIRMKQKIEGDDEEIVTSKLTSISGNEKKSKAPTSSLPVSPKLSGDTVRKRPYQRRSLYGAKKPRRKARSTEPCHCLDCGVLLKTEWALEQHYKNKHSGTNFEIVPTYSQIKGKYNLFLKCLICGKICRSKGRLRQHLREHKRNKHKFKKEEVANVVHKQETKDVDEHAVAVEDEVKPSRKRKRGSCIYHCRSCGGSFPRLYNYNEHKCSQADLNNGDIFENGASDGSNNIEEASDEHCTKIAASDKLVEKGISNQDQSKKHFSKENSKPVGEKNTVDHINELPKKRVSREVLDETKEISRVVSKQPKIEQQTLPSQNQAVTQTMSIDKSVLKSALKPQYNKSSLLSKVRKMTKNKVQPSHNCHYCKNIFTNTKELEKHELMHIESKDFKCTKCGLGFSAMHKLRYHSMRCDPDKRKQRTTNRESYATVASDPTQVDGFYPGKTYPAFANKTEYTVFDPANKPFFTDVNNNIEDTSLYEKILREESACISAITTDAQLAEDAEIDSGSDMEQAKSSVLDVIQIADVRSCHPSFSSAKFEITSAIDPIKSNNAELLLTEQKGTPAFHHQTSATVSGSQVGPGMRPAYYHEQTGQLRGFPVQAGQLNTMPHTLPPPERYANGTVFFVPYFVPSQELPTERHSKGISNMSRIAPKPMQDSDSYSTDVGHIPGTSNFQGLPLLSPISMKSSWVNAWPGKSSKGEADKNLSASLPNQSDRSPTGIKGDVNKHFHECYVCEQKFSTFGNYVKHRELHK